MILIFFFEILVIGLGCINEVTSSHFRGGSIFWKPGNGYEVEFSAKLGWAYNTNACSSSNLNVYRNSSIANWICVSGCPVGTVVNAKRPGFTCTGFDVSQNWERTESTFSYVFPGPGPYVIEFTGGAWISELGGGSWRLTTTVDLHTRSDTLAPNFSPVVPTKPVYYVKYGCKETLRLPVSDEDGDRVACIWSTGLECVDVCYSAGMAPVATLQTNCDLTIDASLDKHGVYALAITIEDKPTSTITIGSTPYVPSRVISSVPLQFVLLTPDLPTRSCSDKPVFLDPTPSENDVLVYRPGDNVSLSFYATSRAATIISFTLLDPPTNVRQSALRNDDTFRPDVYAMDLTWTPVAADRGSKTICVEATDNFLMSTQHCVTLVVLDINPCDCSPCKHNGTCQRQGYMDNYNCACVPGFTGHNCTTDINECASSPCQHNGTCIDLVNEFFCRCLDGYTGFECGIEMNECASSPCHHNGTCYDLVNKYSCGCLDGYTGYDCEIDIDECASSPCQHNGICFDQVNEFICGCLDGYTGFDCGIDINECASSPCKHNGTCFDLVNEFVCGCPDGYTGFDCGIDINECASSPCQHNGTCFDQVNEFFCGCPDGYTDLDCGIDINECASIPCQHNGTCYDLVNEFVCGCSDGYTGFDCGLDINECASSPCKHNGTCYDLVNEFVCRCSDGYTGFDCGIDINECASSPCQNNGTCVDLVNEFVCGCPDGYTDLDCGIDINECASSPCQHNGTCFDQVNEFVCGCLDGYTGFDCGIDINECASSPCQHNGTCFDQVNEFFCGCLDGYTDHDCGIDINECASSPCQHNGTCFDLVNEFFCGCHNGYTGFDCGIDINECDSSPCKHNGTCFDLVNQFACGCLDGYTGFDCGIDINECASSPCQHNGTCLDLVNDFFCGCPDGYSGLDCGIDINECKAQPCKHGGTCVDLVGTSVCQCTQWFTGNICQTGVDTCESLPCENDGHCLFKESSGYICECQDGWVGRQCGHRLENKTFFKGDKTGMTDEYLHYSDCDCVLGSGRQNYCYMYTLNKHSGFGVLAVLLGILSSMILYFLFYCVFNKSLPCFHNRISQEWDHEEKYDFSDTLEEERVEKENEVCDTHLKKNKEVKVSPLEKLDAPKKRKHHCWACEVKYNNAPAPLWYRKDFKKY